MFQFCFNMSFWQNQFGWGRSDNLATGEILRFCVASTSGKCYVHACVIRWVGQKAHPYLKSLSSLFNSSVQLAKDCAMQVSRKLCSTCLFHPMSSPAPPALARPGHDSAPSAFLLHIMGGRKKRTCSWPRKISSFPKPFCCFSSTPQSGRSPCISYWGSWSHPVPAILHYKFIHTLRSKSYPLSLCGMFRETHLNYWKAKNTIRDLLRDLTTEQLLLCWGSLAE